MVLAQLQQDIHVVCILEKVLKLHHILVLDRSVDLDLAHKLLFCSALGETCLQNDFSSGHSTCLLTRELIALRESSLAEEFALDVAADHGLASGFHYALFYDGGNS